MILMLQIMRATTAAAEQSTPAAEQSTPAASVNNNSNGGDLQTVG